MAQVWVILGPPGSGKGTYAALLAARFGLQHLSTGALVREVAKDPRHLDLKRRMDAGQLLPDVTVVGLLREKLRALRSTTAAAAARARGGMGAAAAGGLLLDGFPRNLAQVRLLEEFRPVSLALKVHLDDEHILAKIAGRRVCDRCKKTFNVVDVADPEHGIFMPPILPHGVDLAAVRAAGLWADLHCSCGSLLERRTDDDPTVVAERLRSHHAEESQLLDFYSRRGILLEHRVRLGTGDMDELSDRIRAFLQQRTVEASREEGSLGEQGKEVRL